MRGLAGVLDPPENVRPRKGQLDPGGKRAEELPGGTVVTWNSNPGGMTNRLQLVKTVSVFGAPGANAPACPFSPPYKLTAPVLSQIS
jgi:hypothetical protein